MRSAAVIVNAGREIIWYIDALPAAVASGVPPDVEGGRPAARNQRTNFLRRSNFPTQAAVLLFSAGRDARLYDRPEAHRYGPRRAQRSFAGAERGLEWRSSALGRMTSWAMSA